MKVNCSIYSLCGQKSVLEHCKCYSCQLTNMYVLWLRERKVSPNQQVAVVCVPHSERETGRLRTAGVWPPLMKNCQKEKLKVKLLMRWIRGKEKKETKLQWMGEIMDTTTTGSRDFTFLLLCTDSHCAEQPVRVGSFTDEDSGSVTLSGWNQKTNRSGSHL